MSFNEKLQILRKRDKLSQEQLADMLDVTRQSVSKWESGTTYPEMDKLIALCKIFKCTLDDLTNDDVTDILDEGKRNGNQNIISSLIDNISEIIKKTIEMFRVMNMRQIAGCIITLIFIAIILNVLRIPFDALEHNFYNLFRSVEEYAIVGFVTGFFSMILDITYYILYVLLFVYIYKVAYLDRYNFIQSEKKEIQVTLEEKEIKETKEVTVVKKPNTKENTLFKMLGGIVILFIKFFVVLFSLPVLFGLFFLALGLVFSIYTFTQGIVFVGLLLAIIFAIILCVWFIELVCIFVFNKRASFKRLLWTFIAGLTGFGISCGIFILEIYNLKFMSGVPDAIEKNVSEYEYEMKDDLAIVNGNYWYRDGYISYEIDEALGDKILVEVDSYDLAVDTDIIESNGYYSLIIYHRGESLYYMKSLLEEMKKNLKNGIIYDFDDLYTVKMTVKGTSANIEKIKDNTEDLYVAWAEERGVFNNQLQSYEDALENYETRVSDLESENMELQEELEEKTYELEEYKSRLKELLGE